MKCKRCGHDDSNPVGICMVEVVQKNVSIIGIDGKRHIEPKLHDICACKDNVHLEREAARWRGAR